LILYNIGINKNYEIFFRIQVIMLQYYRKKRLIYNNYTQYFTIISYSKIFYYYMNFMLDIIIYLQIFPIHVENGLLCKDPRDFRN